MGARGKLPPIKNSRHPSANNSPPASISSSAQYMHLSLFFMRILFNPGCRLDVITSLDRMARRGNLGL